LNKKTSKLNPLLLFNANNYSKTLTTTDISRIREYLEDNDYFGDLAIVLSRKEIDPNCEEQIYRLLIGKKKILILEGLDIIKMLHKLDKNLNPFEVIEDAYYNLLQKA
jgi:predicted translin family RNA/ssDNA-binding protein